MNVKFTFIIIEIDSNMIHVISNIPFFLLRMIDKHLCIPGKNMKIKINIAYNSKLKWIYITSTVRPLMLIITVYAGVIV